MLLLLVLLLQLSAPTDSTAVPPADTAGAPADTLRPTAERAAASNPQAHPVEVGFRPVLGAFYSSSKGFGAGGAVEFRNLVAPGTEWDVSAEVMQRFGRFRTSFFTGDPYHTPRFAGLSGSYTTTSVFPFFGIGPRSSRRDRIWVSMEMIEVELRVGWYPLGNGRLLVQPVLRLLHDEVRSFEEDRRGAFERLDPASQENLVRTVDDPTTGLTYGLEVAIDGRDRLFYASKGTLLQLTARRYDGLDARPFRYWTATGNLFHFVPLGRRHVLTGRAVIALTDRIGSRPIPFYALHVLDDKLLGAFTYNRFTGQDLVVLSAEYRFPLFDLLDWYALDGTLHVHLANAYDDLFEQLEAGVSFQRNPHRDGGRVPLRPAASIGARVVDLDKEQVLVSGLVGLSAEGYAFGTVKLVYGIRDLRPVVR